MHPAVDPDGEGGPSPQHEDGQGQSGQQGPQARAGPRPGLQTSSRFLLLARQERQLAPGTAQLGARLAGAGERGAYTAARAGDGRRFGHAATPPAAGPSSAHPVRTPAEAVRARGIVRRGRSTFAANSSPGKAAGVAGFSGRIQWMRRHWSKCSSPSCLRGSGARAGSRCAGA
jgi:hypothetical protein